MMGGMPPNRRRFALVPWAAAFSFAFRSHVEEARWWIGEFDMPMEEWFWWNYALIITGFVCFLYAVLPQRVFSWVTPRLWSLGKARVSIGFQY